MKWIDGSTLDLTQISGEALCEKLALEMYDHDRDHWDCPDFIRNAMCIIDFDSEASMEGFSTPCIGNLTSEYYTEILNAFRAIGDDQDADAIAEALRLDAECRKHLDEAADENEADALLDTLNERIAELEQKLYLNTDFDMWALLYNYLDKQKETQAS